MKSSFEAKDLIAAAALLIALCMMAALWLVDYIRSKRK